MTELTNETRKELFEMMEKFTTDEIATALGITPEAARVVENLVVRESLAFIAKREGMISNLPEGSLSDSAYSLVAD